MKEPPEVTIQSGDYLTFVRTHPENGSWCLWRQPLGDVLDAMKERWGGRYVREQPTEVIQVQVIHRHRIYAKVVVDDGEDDVTQFDGTHPAACGPRCRSQHTDDHSQCPEQFDGDVP